MPTTSFVLIRAVHFASCLVIVGLWAFDRLIAAPIMGPLETAIGRQWNRILRLLAWTMLPAALVSGALWLGLVASNMSGLPLNQAIGPDTLSLVWNRTIFGTVWKWRLVFWIATAFLTWIAMLHKSSQAQRRTLAWCALLASGALAASLAWAGHGIVGSLWHRAADVLHLLAAGCWPAGLLPFLCLLWAARQLPAAEGWSFRLSLTRRFSMMSLIVVAVLCATGLVNSLVLVGSVSSLSTTDYGRWLVVKMFLFLVMIGLGAMNFKRWKPRLAEANENDLNDAEAAERWIRFNVAVELLLGGLVILIVSILGILPYPIQ